MPKIRQSNFELLRILSMIAVLYGHGVGLVLGLPSAGEIEHQPFTSLFQIILSTTFTCGVNVFILISGWFGIHASRQGIYKFLFHIFFLLWAIYLLFIIVGKTSLNIEGIKISMGLTDGYWFIMGYLGLYILSPILNTFVENASKKQFQTLLISFYVFQCFYSWLTNYVNYFAGYSIILFCGLYLTARYFKLYPIHLLECHPEKISSITILLISIIVLFSLKHFGNALHMLRYDSPLIILVSLCLLLLFKRKNFQNKFINWLAASCFSVYIIHFNPFVFTYFTHYSHLLNDNFNGFLYTISIAFFLVVVYFVCVFIDQIRIFIWNIIIGRF